jgi:hypothetical protein
VITAVGGGGGGAPPPGGGGGPTSRRLLTTRIATASSPTGSDATTARGATATSWTNCDPTVATTPKKTKTDSSPRPAEAYGRGPPLYPTAARTQTAPIGTSHHVVAAASATAATAATANAETIAARIRSAVTSPAATARRGPTRWPVSTPRTPSK